MAPFKTLFAFFEILLKFMVGADAKWIFAIEFERYTDNHCAPRKIGHHASVKEDQCKSWPGEPPFTGYRHYWVLHIRLDQNKIEKYGDCMIKFWAEQDCTGELMGKL